MSTQRLAALFLMTAGFGWTAGNFAQPDKPLSLHIFTTCLHALPIFLTILFALPLLKDGKGGPRWARRGMTVLASLYTVAMVGVIAYSHANPDPNAFGIHSLADAEPATVLVVGMLLWLASVVPVRKPVSRAARQQVL